MAFITPRSEIDELKRLIEGQFPASQHEEVYALVEPFITDGGTRLAKCILQLSRGSKSEIEYYVECARKDYRDVIFWAENPEEAALNSPQKIEDFQGTLKWLGLARDEDLDRTKNELLSADQADTDHSIVHRPWWRFW